MPLIQEHPDYRYHLRSATGQTARINDFSIQSSFILTPHALTADWPPQTVEQLSLMDLESLLVAPTTTVILGTGNAQVFPSWSWLSRCLQRGIGIEVMANPAAARTFHILASEGRSVTLGMLLTSP